MMSIIIGLSREGFEEFQKFKKANPMKSREDQYQQVERVEANYKEGRALTHGFNIDIGDGKLEVVGESQYTYPNLNNLEKDRLQTALYFRMAVERRSIDELIEEFANKKLSYDYTSEDNFEAFVEALKENEHLYRNTRERREDKKHINEPKED